MAEVHPISIVYMGVAIRQSLKRWLQPRQRRLSANYEAMSAPSKLKRQKTASTLNASPTLYFEPAAPSAATWAPMMEPLEPP
jgi:hypothetical protein